MARPNGMTRSEAETAIGPRGTTPITSENRNDCRKWLVACGVASPYAYDMRLSDLDAAYNDTADRELRAHIEASGNQLPLPTPPAAAPDSNDEQARRALRLLNSLGDIIGPKAAVVDADTVRAIVAKELAKITPTVRIEIQTGDTVRDHGAKPRHKDFAVCLKIVATNTPLMLVGPAGSGKTTFAEQVAECLELPFYLQGAASAHEYVGYCDGYGKYHTTPFRQAFEHGGVFLGDELDASPDGNAPLILNAALANGHMAFPDSAEPIKRHENFRCIAAANTYGHGADRVYVGRTQLDGATIDRFAVFNWDYDAQLEESISGNPAWARKVQAIRAAVFKEKARLLVTPRATIYGARLLAAGLDDKTVLDAVVWKGTDSELRRRIESAVPAEFKLAA